MSAKETTKSEAIPGHLQELFAVGAHFGFAKSRRHPTFKQVVFGVKNGFEIIDLEKTISYLDNAIAFVKELGAGSKRILFVSSKSEAKDIVKNAAESIGMPYVAGRWIGGTLTNFGEVKKRVDRLHDLTSKREKGELSKYTKKERLMFDREIETLTKYFAGLSGLEKTPDALFIVDPKKEHIAVEEAVKMKVPVIALASTDCDLKAVTFPIPGNDSSRISVQYFVDKIASAYKEASGK